MQFVQGLPLGVYVGQTQVEHAQTQPTARVELTGFNLALHVGDDVKRVQQHRMALLQQFAVFGVDKLTWLSQTHSTLCHRIDDVLCFDALEGDGLITQRKAHALMMMTADCLPIVLGNAAGTEVANVHAGWRGLAQGIVEQTISDMHTQPTWAWLGAAISQAHFEVGTEVKLAFCTQYPALQSAFKAGITDSKFYADLYAIARYILQQHGVETVLGGEQCTYLQVDDYFSYRRTAQTGRMATFVFMA